MWNGCNFFNTELINPNGERFEAVEFHEKVNGRFFNKIAELANQQFQLKKDEILVIDEIIMDKSFYDNDSFKYESYTLNTVMIPHLKIQTSSTITTNHDKPYELSFKMFIKFLRDNQNTNHEPRYFLNVLIPKHSPIIFKPKE